MNGITKAVDAAITSAIKLARQLNSPVRTYSLGKSDFGYDRWTEKRKTEISEYCKTLRIDAVFYSETDSYVLTFNIHEVVMNPSQANLYMELSNGLKSTDV